MTDPQAVAQATPAPNADVDINAQLLSELETLSDESSEPAELEPATEEAAEASSEVADVDESADADAASVDVPAEDGDVEAVAEAAAASEEEPEDPVLAKRLSSIQKAEAHSKRRVAAERAALEKQSAEMESRWAPLVEKAKRFEELKSNPWGNAPQILEELGIGIADFEEFSKQIYRMSPAAAADPAAREFAAREARTRAANTEVAALRRELQEERRQAQEWRQQQDMQVQVQTFFSNVEKAIDGTAPTVQRLFEKNPTAARKRLSETTQTLIAETGETPDASDVVAALEQEFEDMGLSISKSASSSKTPNPAAAKTQSAKTISNDLGTNTPSKSVARTHEEEAAAVLRDLEAGALD